uniref:GTD-binding domain-containing protein n=1 Tax=Kalanchoe fedtschenkoi TaxID=63787 RepID=A0A7N0TUV6_KALFE
MAVAENVSQIGTSSDTHRDATCLVNALSSAACEWFLIILLFLHGLLSYFLREFAKYCKLPTPCLFCSRLDHYFGSKMPKSHQSMFCYNHGLEISSHGMCEDCLFSYATKNKSHPKSHSSVNKMSRTLQQNKSIYSYTECSASGPVDRRACSCCDKLWASRQIQQRATRYRSPVRGSSKPNIPLPNEPSRNSLSRRDNMRRSREKSHGSLYSKHFGSDIMDPPASCGYKVVKVTSNSESEAPFSDGDNGRVMDIGINALRGDTELRNTSVSLADAQINIMAHLKPVNKICTPSPVGADEGATNFKISNDVQNSNPPASFELISLNDNPPMYNPLYDPIGIAIGEHASGTSLILAPIAVTPLDSIPLDFPCPSSKHIELPVKESLENSHSNGTNHEHAESVDALRATFTSAEDKLNDISPSTASEYADSYGSPALIVSDKGLKASKLASIDETMKIPNGVELECQLSSTNEEYVQGTELQSNITSSEHRSDNVKSHFSTPPSCGECMTPVEVDSSEKNESAFESTAGSVVSDREGESLLDRLKRQIEYDKERITSLYKELDEERSASAIAANQAMAMITRLQEEKAALNMEALHYLRMMEEQAEYDVEALEKANDLLSEKEKEIQDMEAELERYRSNVLDGSMAEKKNELACTSEAELASNLGNGKAIKDQKHLNSANGSESVQEMLCISECLKKIEQRLLQISSSGVTTCISNCIDSEMMEARWQNGSQPDDCAEDNGSSCQKEIDVSNGNFNIPGVKEPEFLKSEALEEMEANNDCREMSLESLQNGHEGLLVIKKIAYHLQELRKLVLLEQCIGP